MSEIYFAYLLGKNLPFLQLPYLYLVKQKKSVTKIMLATEYSSLRTPKKTPPKHTLPTIFQSSSIYPTISQIPVVLQWHPHATLGLNASSHHCRRCRPTTSTTSRHHATWRIGGRARPKTSQTSRRVFSMMGVFCVFCWVVRRACERSKLMLCAPVVLRPRFAGVHRVLFFFRYYSCMTYLTSPSS